MAKAALAFAAGFGTGYLNQKRQNQADAERQEDRAMRKQEFDDQQEERGRIKRDRAAMSKAGETRETNEDAAVVEGLSTKPVVYEDADVASGDLRQDRRLREASASQAAPTADGPGLGMQLPPTPQPEKQDSTTVDASATNPNAAPAPTMRKAVTSGGQEYATREEADAATKKFNDGRGERVSQELYRQGEPGKAMQMEAGTMELAEKKRTYAQKMLDEGAEQVATASRKGDPEAVRAAANAGGEYKIEGEIKVTPETRKVPGLGEIPTYNYTFSAIGKDGKPREMSFNSHDLSMQTLNFKEILKVTADGRAADDKSAYQLAQADANMKRAEAAELRAGIYGSGAGRGSGAGTGAGKVSALTKEVDDAWDRANTGNTKLEADQLMPGRRLTEELMVNEKIPSALAAEVAYAVTKDPASVRPAVDPASGHINGVFNHPSRKEIVINRDIASGTKPSGLSTAEMTTLANSYLAKLPPADRATMLEAVRNPAKMQSMVDELYGQARKQAEARAKANPSLSAADNDAWLKNYMTVIREATQRKADLVERFGPKPAPTKKESAATVANPLAGDGAEPAAKPATTSGAAVGRSRAPGMKDGSLVGGIFGSVLSGAAPAASVSPTSLGDDFESPGAKAALTERVRRQGANGAPPLSDVEFLRARQLGLV